MNLKRLLLSLIVALAVLAAFNVFLALRIDSVPNGIMRGMKAQTRIDILFLGSSLIQSGFDPDAFAQAWPPDRAPVATFNAGLGSSSAVEHDLLLRDAYRHHATIPHLVYGFYDLHLTEKPDDSWTELTGNKSMAYADEPAVAASLYAPGSEWEKWRFRFIGAIPMLREHSQLWKYVEVFRRWLQEIGLPKQEVNAFGRVADFDALAFPSLPDFTHDAETVVRTAAPFSPPVQAIFQLAREHGTDLVVVEMPMTSTHRRLYYATRAWQNYRAYLKQRLQAEGITYLEADDWVPDDADFRDGVHLNAAGASVFSTRIAQDLAGRIAP